MKGLNDISGITRSSLPEWYGDKKFIIPLGFQNKNTFQLELTEPKSLLSAFAFDCDRLATAAFETMYFISRNPLLPRSFGWLIIKCYYSAFFSAHSILRILGKSCSQLDSVHVGCVNQIAKAYGLDNNIEVASGYYYCKYSSNFNSDFLNCDNIKASGKGSHEAFWKIFHQELGILRDEILNSSQSISIEAQSVALKIDDMRASLCSHGCNGGNWLSQVRNNVNYKHQLSAWFPSSRSNRNIADELYEIYYDWLKNPMDIDLVRTSRGTDLLLFVKTCSFIVGFCRVLLEDMASRCSSGKSYLAYGSMRLLNTICQNTAV